MLRIYILYLYVDCTEILNLRNEMYFILLCIQFCSYIFEVLSLRFISKFDLEILMFYSNFSVISLFFFCIKRKQFNNCKKKKKTKEIRRYKYGIGYG